MFTSQSLRRVFLGLFSLVVALPAWVWQPSISKSAATCTGANPLADGRLVRLAGSDRAATAVAISQARFAQDGSADTAVVARQDVFADGLVGGPLARFKNGPLLLSRRDGIQSSVLAELKRTLPPGKRVYLLGGIAALNSAVEKSIRDSGYLISRVSGTTRYETAAAAAEIFGFPTKVGVASGEDFPDALALSSPAARGGFPLLLVQQTQVPDSTREYLRNLGTNPTVYLSGGSAAVDNLTAQDLDELAENGPLKRLAGSNRFETAQAIANELFGPNPCTIALASGRSFADALTGAAHAATHDAPLLLLEPDALPTTTQTLLENAAGPIAGGFLYGGTAVVDDATAVRVNGTFEPDTFIFWGDSGESNSHWNNIAAQINARVAAEDIDGLLMLGDNVYDVGATNASDPAFATLYENPLAPTIAQLPIHVVLGNHDVITANGQYELDYATTHPYWIQPSRYYNRTIERTCLTALDTNQSSVDSTQLDFLQNACNGSTALHKLAIGHHPVVSSGEHGIANDQPWMAALVEPVLQSASYNFYLSGHDHDFEAIIPSDTNSDPRYIISGGASRLRPVAATSNSLFATSQYHFSKLELYSSYADLTIYDENGGVIWTYRYSL